MQSVSLKVRLLITVMLVAAGFAAWEPLRDLAEAPARRDGGARSVPVEVAAIERGPIELRRSFTGTLDAHAELVVAPKVSGRIEQLSVNLADTVTRGQVVAKLDNAEYVQAVAQAQADLAVARANLAEAENLLRIAERELQRIQKLRERGLTSGSQRDVAKADQLAKQAHVEVTKAQVTRAEAEVETARIRLGYTEVKADWRGGDEERVVGERYVDEGETVSANTPLLRIVELDPIIAAFHITEREYALVHPGQSAVLRTDAYPDELFQGRITRIAPVFSESTRQARVEIWVGNPQLRLKPGMFVRAMVVLDRVRETTIVPEQALATRDGRTGVFVVANDGQSVSWREVQVGIREGSRVQVIGDGLAAHVVTLGQQLLDDNASVTVAGSRIGVLYSAEE